MLFGSLLFICTFFAVPVFASEADLSAFSSDEINGVEVCEMQPQETGDGEVDVASEGVSDYVTRYSNQYIQGSIQYGSWRNGTSGGSDVASIELSLNNTHDSSFDISFTASVAGKYTLSNGVKIGSDLNVTLGMSKNYSLGSGTSVTVPKGSRYLIKYRPAYYRYTVIETTYHEAFIIGFGWQSFEMGTKTSYVNVFSHWDYTVAVL